MRHTPSHDLLTISQSLKSKVHSKLVKEGLSYSDNQRSIASFSPRQDSAELLRYLVPRRQNEKSGCAILHQRTLTAPDSKGITCIIRQPRPSFLCSSIGTSILLCQTCTCFMPVCAEEKPGALCLIDVAVKGLCADPGLQFVRCCWLYPKEKYGPVVLLYAVWVGYHLVFLDGRGSVDHLLLLVSILHREWLVL